MISSVVPKEAIIKEVNAMKAGAPFKMVSIETATEWLKVMAYPDGFNKSKVYYRLCGACAILTYLGIITQDEGDKILDEYLTNNGTGINPCHMNKAI